MSRRVSLQLFIALIFPVVLHSQVFVHPGLLHGIEDLGRMKDAVLKKQDPIYSGYLKFIQDPASSYNYKMVGPKAMVGRNPNINAFEYDSDANAAHQNAIMWYITGEKAYADKAIEIVNSWSYTLKSITGRDAVLMAGLGPFKMVNAAEILRYSNSGWAEKDIKQAENNFKEVIYPVLKNFAPFANGNWDAAAMKTTMSIGVFCNDREIFERALCYYVNGHGDGCITNYIINESGQIQESGRDQAHTQLGVAMLAECSEIAWHQGLNLYAYDNNLLLKGFEYVAKFNLGNDDVPFSIWLDRTGKYRHDKISQLARNHIRAVYEQILNHYTNQMGIEAPYVKQAVEKIRPEGPGNPGADHPGYGTLYYSRPAEDAVKLAQNTIPAQPGAVIAKPSSNAVSLTWVASTSATGYTVKRACKSGGPYTVIGATAKAEFKDDSVKSGVLYYYTVSANNKKGASPDSYKTSISAGLPLLWSEQTIGQTQLKGYTQYDGKTFSIEAPGRGLDSISDSFQYVYFPLNCDGEISVRYVPQISSQFSQFGLMARGNLSDKSANVSLVIYPSKTKEIEAPTWSIHFISRPKGGSKAQTLTVSSLAEPVVTYGRMTGEFWLKLQRKGMTITGYVSVNGLEWTLVGESVLKSKKLLLGMSASSGIDIRTTNVRFDDVKVK